jgi:thiazole synthase
VVTIEAGCLRARPRGGAWISVSRFAGVKSFQYKKRKSAFMSSVVTAVTDPFKIANRTFRSRLIIGTGKYRSYEEMKAAHRASGAEMVTVAVRRVPLDRSSESFLDHLDPSLQILPNTAGCYSAEEAVRTARLAREALDTEWIKLEVIGDQTTLFPDNEQTLDAARLLVKEGFLVLPYFSDDLIMAKKLLDAGCPAVMPLAAPIGSGLGVQNPANLRIMREQLPDATIIVDAGVGTASDAAIAMELGADAVLMNTAIAEANDSAKMAEAMKLAIEAGRLAYLSGRMSKRLYASASSPLTGVVR